jgi:isopenicillin N synthase-like dioxygenase
VNIGDLFQRWTNDRCKATMHRVQNPAPGSPQSDSSRLSLVLFTGPVDEATIETIESCVDDQGGKKYPPINAGYHLRLKLQRSNV